MDENHDENLTAFGLGITESDEGWIWFVQRLNERLWDGMKVTFISSMSNSIELAISIVNMDSNHGYSCMNVSQNL